MLPLLRDSRFQFVDFPVLFEEFVEQHGVHLVVAHTVGFSFLVTHDQIWIYFFNFFSHQPKLRDSYRINFLFITETNRIKRKERLTCTFHWLDLLLKPSGRSGGAKLIVVVNENRGSSGRSHSEDVTNIAAAIHVFTTDGRADTNDVSRRGDIAACLTTYGDI